MAHQSVTFPGWPFKVNPAGLIACLSASLSVCQSLSVYPSIDLSIYLSIISVYLSVYLSLYTSIYPSIYLSLCLSVFSTAVILFHLLIEDRSDPNGPCSLISQSKPFQPFPCICLVALPGGSNIYIYIYILYNVHTCIHTRKCVYVHVCMNMYRNE